jgi:probable HAF family extracellular repeat protein
MTDLLTLGGTSANAFGVSADGSVVVGDSNLAGDTAFHAFRWTAATGQGPQHATRQSGVDMTGIELLEATGVSANGQFMGYGNFSGPDHAYIVRYFDGIGGLTTPEAVQDSINHLGETRFGVMAQEHGLAVPLLGDNQPIAQGNEAGVFGTAGSAQGGGYSRIGLTPGLALLAGAAYGSAEFESANIDNSFIGAAALRYVKPNEGSWHPFAEGGGWFAPNADLTFDRTYMNGAGHGHGHRPHRWRCLLCLRPGRAGVRSWPPSSACAFRRTWTRMARCRRL